MKLIHSVRIAIAIVIGCGLFSANAIATTSLPIIVADPSNQTVIEGQSASFTVVAEGTGLTYQWQKNGKDIYGATGPTYVILLATRDLNEAVFRCRVQNATDTVTSKPSTLTVYPEGSKLPIIVKQPIDRKVVEGEYAVFSISAKGDGLTYQWQRNGKKIVGATGSNYTILLTVLGDDNSVYRCRVKNRIGETISDAAKLSIIPLNPSIQAHPASITVTENQSAHFSIEATGAKIRYQWVRNNKKVRGANKPTYTINKCRPPDDGDILQCIVSNSHGRVASKKATLSIFLNPPKIKAQPEDATISENNTAKFSISAHGSNLNYQWHKNGKSIPNATSESYTTPIAGLSDDGCKYSCMVTNSGGAVMSREVTLSVIPGLPLISENPSDIKALEGTQATFKIEVMGSNLTYQWQKNCIDIPDATQPALNLSSVAYTDDGATFRCIVSNPLVKVTSKSARLEVVLLPPNILAQPESLLVKEGETAIFQVEADGTRIAYQWQHNGTDIEGATQKAYRLPSATVTDAGQYYCCLNNSAGSIESDMVSLAIIPNPPCILSNPHDVSVINGEPATLMVEAEGSQLSYQWQKNAIDIEGATEARLTIYPKKSDDQAELRCVVFNPGGRQVSQSAILAVKNHLPKLPIIFKQPQSINVIEGNPAVFSLSAIGNPLQYQWQKNNEDISGANSAALNIESANPVDSGEYRCIITNASGKLMSLPALLTIMLAPSPSIDVKPENTSGNAVEPTGFTETTEDKELTYQGKCFYNSIGETTEGTPIIPEIQFSQNGKRNICILNDKTCQTKGQTTEIEAPLNIDKNPASALVLHEAYETPITEDSILIQGHYEAKDNESATVTAASDQYPDQLFNSALDPQGDFSCDIPIKLGCNQIEIMASDDKGNHTSTTIQVFREVDKAASE